MLASVIISPDDSFQDLQNANQTFKGATDMLPGRYLSVLQDALAQQNNPHSQFSVEEVSCNAHWWRPGTREQTCLLLAKAQQGKWSPYLAAGSRTGWWAVGHPGGKAWVLWTSGEEYSPSSCSHLGRKKIEDKWMGNHATLELHNLDTCKINTGYKFNILWRVIIKNFSDKGLKNNCPATRTFPYSLQ